MGNPVREALSLILPKRSLCNCGEAWTVDGYCPYGCSAAQISAKEKLAEEYLKLRDSAEKVVAAWNDGWDCSASPGHPEIEGAICELGTLLSERRANGEAPITDSLGSRK